MKRNYDKKSTDRRLQVGDLALILQPSSASKLQFEWKGPFEVMRCLEHNNYELSLGHRKTMLHINSLRKFHTYDDNDHRPVMTAFVEEWDGYGNFNWFDYRQITDDDPALRPTGAAANVASELDGVRVINRETSSGQACDAHDEEPAVRWRDDVSASSETQWAMGKNLAEEQRRQLTELLDEYADVFDPKPGKTDLITHKIHVTDDTPIWQQSYPIPLALRDQVEDELQKLLDADIIQYDAETRYNSPLIVIKKPDGGVRLCNNFVMLNQKSVPEKYQMTDPNKLLSRVAGATWVSKLDLNKYFFQIDLHADSQHLTGFWTPFGQMSYKRLPMGLSGSPITAQRLIDIVLRGARRQHRRYSMT